MICHLLKPDNRYRNYRLRLQPRGERARIINLQTRDKEVALSKRQKIVSEMEREKEGLIPAKTLRDALAKPLPTLLEEFLQELHRQGRRPDYVRQVRNRLPVLAKACHWKTMRDVTPKAYLDWRNAQKNLSPRTLNHFLDAARTFFNWVDLVYEVPNPLKRLQKLKVKAKYAQGNRAFSKEEVNRLLASADKWHTLYLLLLLTGLRHGEAKKLIWADIHFGEKPFLQLREEATKSWRADKIDLNSYLARELEAMRPAFWKPDMLVFRKGVAMNRTLKKDLVKAGIPLIDEYGRPAGFHTFRRTFVTLSHTSGIAPRIVQQLARHKRSDLTDFTYTDTTKLDTHAAVERLGVFLEESPGQYAVKYAVVSGQKGQNVSKPDHEKKLSAENPSPEVTDNEPAGTLLGGLAQLSPNSPKVVREGVEPPKGRAQLIYSQRPLATWLPHHKLNRKNNQARAPLPRLFCARGSIAPKTRFRWQSLGWGAGCRRVLRQSKKSTMRCKYPYQSIY